MANEEMESKCVPASSKGDVQCDVRSDARYFIAERQVHERYVEQIEGHGPRQLESADLSKRVDDDQRLLDAARCCAISAVRLESLRCSGLIRQARNCCIARPDHAVLFVSKALQHMETHHA